MERRALRLGGALSLHHTLGRDIRNRWNLWDKQRSPLARSIHATLGIDHPDDMSHLILMGARAFVVGEPFDPAAAARDMRAPMPTGEVVVLPLRRRPVGFFSRLFKGLRR